MKYFFSENSEPNYFCVHEFYNQLEFVKLNLHEKVDRYKTLTLSPGESKFLDRGVEGCRDLFKFRFVFYIK